MKCCFIHQQARRATVEAFLVRLHVDEHVYQVHPINVQLVTNLVKMLNKEGHGCDFAPEIPYKYMERDI